MSSKLSLPLILRSIVDQGQDLDLDPRLTCSFKTTMAQPHLVWAKKFFCNQVIPLLAAQAGRGCTMTTIMTFCPEDIRYVDPHCKGALEYHGYMEEKMLFHGRAAALLEISVQAGLK